MAYRFAPHEGLPEGFGRVGRDQLDRAVHELTDQIKANPEDAVHAARKALKKERSLLRLARGSLTPARRRRLNARLRATARGLGTTRDADAMLGALDALADRFAGQIPATTFDTVRVRLQAQRDDARHSADSVTDAVAELHVARDDFESLHLRRGGFKALEPGLARSYRRGRRAMRRAQRDPTDENLHAWRKRAKDLWYHLRVLREIAPHTMSGQVREAHALADLLGDDHDLAVLEPTVRALAPDVAVDLGPLLALIAHRRHELQEQARWAGARLYAEPASAFTGRLRRYWKATRAEVRAARAHDPAGLAAASRHATV